MPEIPMKRFWSNVERGFDRMLSRLSCHDGNDARMVSHWQEEPRGFRLQVTRKGDGASLTRFIGTDGSDRA